MPSTYKSPLCEDENRKPSADNAKKLGTCMLHGVRYFTEFAVYDSGRRDTLSVSRWHGLASPKCRALGVQKAVPNNEDSHVLEPDTANILR